MECDLKFHSLFFKMEQQGRVVQTVDTTETTTEYEEEEEVEATPNRIWSILDSFITFVNLGMITLFFVIPRKKDKKDN